jgi:hypothetical protein
MRKRSIIQFSLATALAIGMSAVISIAGDPVFMLTHGHQDVLVLGTVVAATPELLQFQPTVEIPGQQHPLGLDELLKIGGPQPISIRQPDGARWMVVGLITLGTTGQQSIFLDASIGTSKRIRAQLTH